MNEKTKKNLRDEKNLVLKLRQNVKSKIKIMKDLKETLSALKKQDLNLEKTYRL